ncbi:uncharacterized protein LOC113457613 [Microtus ochrogaster]|uniref:Uncharacterized protein LOC113457613 n=1 Tax=Microtus ochrogaster TaxID=79684 RepID=A0ABM1UID6_MICOH|nr:uncharacterized protein LOC113457613 [Microtus ochrogaster]
MVLWAGQIALPPPFVRVTGPGLRRLASGSQIRRRWALGESRVLLVAFLQKTVSSDERRRREERARVGAFCLLWTPESWIPWRGFSPPSGFPHCRRDPFQELLGCGLAAEHRPLGLRLRRLLVRRSGETPSAVEGGSLGAAQAASGRDPRRQGASKPGGNSFFPHSAPRGMQAEKETAEAGQTLAGGGGNTKWLRVWSAPARTPSQFAGGFGAEGVRLLLSI